MNRREDHSSSLRGSNWYILGPGAIGSLWASRFTHHGTPVSLICRTPQSARQLGRGLTIENQQGSHLFYPHCVTCDQIPSPCNRLLITCKAHQTKTALDSIKAFINAETQIVLLQNGIGIANEIQRQFPHNPLTIGITNEAAYRKAPNHIVHAATGQTWLGPYSLHDNTSTKHPAPTQDQSPLTLLAPQVEWDTHIMQRVWQKFAINCAINGLTVLYQCRNGQLLDQNKKQQHLQRICHEIDQVLEATPHSGTGSTYEKAVAIASQTAPNYSSMLQDFKHNKSLEIDYLNGYLCELATQNNIRCEENRTLTQQLKKLHPNSAPANLD